jgi:hypothetical protein
VRRPQLQIASNHVLGLELRITDVDPIADGLIPAQMAGAASSARPSIGCGCVPRAVRPSQRSVAAPRTARPPAPTVAISELSTENVGNTKRTGPCTESTASNRASYGRCTPACGLATGASKRRFIPKTPLQSIQHGAPLGVDLRRAAGCPDRPASPHTVRLPSPARASGDVGLIVGIE